VVALMRRAMNAFTGEHYVDDVTMLVMRASREDTRAGQRDRRRAASRRRVSG
jgi:hypothetical protein